MNIRNITLKDKLLVILILISTAIPCIAQSGKQNYTRAYDLDFKMLPDSLRPYRWIENGAYALYTILWGVKGPMGTLYTRRYIKEIPIVDRLRTEFSHRILLPHDNLKEGVVGLECKGSGLKRVVLTLQAIDEEEKVVATGSFICKPDSVLKTYSTHINLTNASSLNIGINALGEERKDAYIAFSKLKVTLDNKPIDDYPVRTLAPLSVEGGLNLIREDSNHCFDLAQIDGLRDKRIIGLGESLHGNSDVKSFVTRLIEASVKRHDCRLVLMEFPLGKSLFFNRYIQDDSFTMDSSLIPHPTVSTLLNVLRTYNRGRADSDKVRLFGIDYTHQKTISMSSTLHLFDFIAALNKEQHIPEADRLAVMIMKDKLADAVNYLDKHRAEIAKLLSDDEMACFDFVLKLNVQHQQTPSIERFVQRDSTMALSAKFLIDRCATDKREKVFIYSHAAHVNPVSTYPAVPCQPMGSYLRKAYGDDYCPLLLVTEGGDAIATDISFGMKDAAINKAPANSLEYCLNASTDASVYLPMTPAFNRLIPTRFKGAYHVLQEFFPINVYQRFNGVFFVKHDEKNNVHIHQTSLEDGSKLAITNMKQRKQLLKEMEDRLKTVDNK